MSQQYHRSHWKLQAKLLLELLQSGGRNEDVQELLKSLNALVYPVENLTSEDAEHLLRCFVKHGSVLKGEQRIQVALLTYNLQTFHKAVIPSDVGIDLLHIFLSQLTSTYPPNELLYAAASIVLADIIPEDPGTLFEKDRPLLAMCLSSEYPVETQRAALDFATSLCEHSKELSVTVLTSVMDALLESMGSDQSRKNQVSSLLLHKLLLSKLRFMHSLMPHLSPFPSSSLPRILSTFKANMTLGLPRQSATTSSSIDPPLSLPQVPHHSAAKSKPVSTGRSQKKNKRGKGGNKDADSGEDSAHLSSEGELSSSSTGNLVQGSRNSPHKSGYNRREKGCGPARWKTGASSSEGSDVSDNEASKLNSVLYKIRLEALSNLSLVFQLVDQRTTFSYWLSFLPDGPHPPNSPSLLPSCILKDPSPKCRGAAVSLLCCMLDGSRQYLAAADDKSQSTLAFIPYSVTLGGVVRELHGALLLALKTEPNLGILLLLLKALQLLIANTSYHQLSNNYIALITTALERVSVHKDMQVQAAALTCLASLVCMTPTHKEVEVWLSGFGGGSSMPWLFQHCVALLQMQCSPALQTEALKVLAALTKFCFSQIQHCWGQLKDLYFTTLVSFPTRIQPHVLKVLEELCRTLSPSPSVELVSLWEDMLSGPITALLQNYHEVGSLASQACDILSTLPSQTMASLKVPLRILALSLPLELSGDDDASNSVNASAVRILGIFSSFESLREDDSFFLDCQSVIAHCLSSSGLSVRVQASWAMANLADSFSLHPHLLQPKIVSSLSESILLALQKGDKVRSNAVRAAGNLLKQLPEDVLPDCKDILEKLSLQLAKCINLGSMKTRWNACYACHSAMCNEVFISNFPSCMAVLVSSLCAAMQSCKNFKVRHNAAMALTDAAKGHVLTRQQWSEVWVALWKALENAEQQVDFTEFKHAATLKEQLCMTICYMLLDFTVGETTPLSYDFQESSLKHFSYFLSRALQLDDAASDLDKKNRYDFIYSVYDSLKKLMCSEEEKAVKLSSLWDVFEKWFVENDKDRVIITVCCYSK